MTPEGVEKLLQKPHFKMRFNGKNLTQVGVTDENIVYTATRNSAGLYDTSYIDEFGQWTIGKTFKKADAYNALIDNWWIPIEDHTSNTNILNYTPSMYI